MIVGAHSIVYSTNAEADRAFLRDVLGFPHVDVGGGWLIFGLPPSEVAVHPAESNDEHELYLMCDDVAAFVAEMAAKGHACEPPQDQGYGIMTAVTLPGGGKLGVYQARHARPPSSSQGSGRAARRKASRPRKTAPAKAAPAKAAGPQRKAPKPRKAAAKPRKSAPPRAKKASRKSPAKAGGTRRR